MAILRLAMETQALPTDDALDQPLRRHQRDFLRRHVFLYQWRTGTVCHHNIILARRNVCRWRGEKKLSITEFQHNIYYNLDVMWWESIPEPSLSAWNCRREEPPPKVISCAQSSTGFSNTRRTRRALNGLQRGCLIEEKIYILKQKVQLALTEHLFQKTIA